MKPVPFSIAKYLPILVLLIFLSFFAHLGNISHLVGRPASPKEITEKLETLEVNDDALAAFERVREHLADNGVDIEKKPLTLGAWLDIDSESETFTNNPAANSLLTREYRKPFVVPPADAI